MTSYYINAIQIVFKVISTSIMFADGNTETSEEPSVSDTVPGYSSEYSSLTWSSDLPCIGRRGLLDCAFA